MEEAGKVPLIMSIFLLGQSAERWKEYSSHPAKTRHVNYGISLQIKVQFPNLPNGSAETIGNLGPTPEVLEKAKQRSVYSDCLTVKGKCHGHKPNAIDWRSLRMSSAMQRSLLTDCEQRQQRSLIYGSIMPINAKKQAVTSTRKSPPLSNPCAKRDLLRMVEDYFGRRRANSIALKPAI
jgi:hypothetical protein